MPSDALFTSGHTIQEPKKRATLSHFFSGARRLSGRRLCSTTHFAVRTFDREGPFSASQKASWRTCTGKRPAISAGVHYLPVSLSCATQRVRPGRLTTPRGVPCPRKKSPCRTRLPGGRLDRCAARRNPGRVPRWRGAEAEFPADACVAGVGVRQLLSLRLLPEGRCRDPLIRPSAVLSHGGEVIRGVKAAKNLRILAGRRWPQWLSASTA